MRRPGCGGFMSTFGEELKRERELREITLREISEATKINLRYLEAMESNEFGSLPGGLFNRGFVRAYAQFIGVDPEAMVTAYLMEEQQQAGRRGGSDRGLLRGGQRNRETTLGEPAARRAPRLLWWVVAVAIVLILTGAYLVYRWLTTDAGAPRTQARISRAVDGVNNGG